MRTVLILATVLVAVTTAAGQKMAAPSPNSVPAEYQAEVSKGALPPDTDKVVSIIGDVRASKIIVAREGLTVTKVIESAGGFDDFARPRKVRVWKRKEGRFFTVDVTAIRAGKGGIDDPLLDGGDVVIVIKRQLDYWAP